MLNHMATNDKVPTGTLLVFSKTKLFLLFFTSMMIGTAFFFFGFFMGYNTGKEHVIERIHSNIKNKRKLEAELKNKLKLNKNIETTYSPKQSYIVHIGLFNNAEYAQKAWLEISDYAKLSENQAIKKITINNQTFYKVILGEFPSQEYANAFANMIIERTNHQISPILEKSHDKNPNTSDAKLLKGKK